MFDDIKYDIGYGEECDWCCRAKEFGYKNVLLTTLFIQHHGTSSFDNNVRLELSQDHSKILIESYPQYEILVDNIIKNLKFSEIRKFLFLKILNETTKTILYFDHNLGGGTKHYRDNILIENKDNLILVITSDINNYSLDAYHKNFHINLIISDIDDFLNYIKINEIIISSLIMWKKLEKIINIIKKQNKKTKYLVHDYHCICPNVNLMYNETSFCNIDLKKM
jgi:hypothetical protein